MAGLNSVISFCVYNTVGGEDKSGYADELNTATGDIASALSAASTDISTIITALTDLQSQLSTISSAFTG